MSAADLALVRTLRETAVAFRRPRLQAVRVGGAHAWELLDRVLPCELYLREGQLQPTLLLHEDGRIAADLTVGADAEDFWLLVEGMSGGELVARLAAEVAPGEEVVLEDLSASRSLLAVEGPYSWRVLEEAGHTGAARLPFLAFHVLDSGAWVARTGRSGEYGYLLMVARGDEADQLAALGEIPLAGPAELAHVTVEAMGYDVHAPASRGLDPLSLQLQWRLSRRKESVRGMAALAVARTDPDRQRIVGLRGPGALSEGTPLLLEGEPVGRVHAAVPWLGLEGGSVGTGLLPLALAHPGLALETVLGPVQTVSPPFFLARSFRLKPSPRAPAPDDLPPPYT